MQYKNIEIARSRQQALNMGISAFLISGLVFGVVNVAALRAFSFHVIPESIAVAGIIAVYQFAKALKKFTDEDRDLMFNFQPVQEDVFIEDDDDAPLPVTQIPSPRGRGVLRLGVGLTNQQMEQVARTAKATGSLTINGLTAAGISRGDAEALRSELASFGLGTFDGKKRFLVNKDGMKSFDKIV